MTNTQITRGLYLTMYLKLINSTPTVAESHYLSPIDESVVKSARVSYNGGLKNKEKDTKLIKYLVSNKHYSTLEHAFFTFEVYAPLFVARQIMRHRTFSYNEISLRYSKFDNKVYVPKKFLTQSKTNKQMSEDDTDIDQGQIKKIYNFSVNISLDTYNRLLEEGVSREQARMVLPVSLYTKFIMSGNLRNWLQFIELRTDKHVQYETRYISLAIKEEIKKYAPIVLEAWENDRNR